MKHLVTRYFYLSSVNLALLGAAAILGVMWDQLLVSPLPDPLDKLVHLCYFAALTVILYRLMNKNIIPAFLCAFALGILGECLHGLLTSDPIQVMDFVANGLGVTATVSLMGLIRSESEALQRCIARSEHDLRPIRIKEPVQGPRRFMSPLNR
ncbi:hypothetical protein [Pseudovibrio sp. SPO723]|uniref:hypothetical protein n=1 Tax=Nesiotobacter zosterae TaxID=392721 RepID=UPI0029C2EAC6|nr:hypothetical protein [Pseudovibrio sp. SPO723]MDX5595139.1 hypothetical protein [Pseudovibrio sp. SPO723]